MADGDVFSHMVPPRDQDELRRLREENERLKALLTQHGIPWEEAPATESPETHPKSASIQTHFTTADKVALFRRLFRGREDVYPHRWESARGLSGYTPACDNEWKPGVCHKPKVKCGDCNQRQLVPVTDQVIYDHLAGKQTIGVYPLLSDDSCYFLAADFDEANWQEDAKAFIQSCRELSIPAALEISSSGNGAHAWIFFAVPVPARETRQLGAALISHTCDRTRQLSLASYDRLFPNQDTMPKGGLGVIGGGKKKPSGKIDIAVMQSLSRRVDLGELLDQYGQIIIDECHHLPAFSFESILKQAKAKFVVGLTATLIRRDGHQPIIFMQCGPIRHSAARPETTPAQLEVWPKVLPAPEIPPNSPIQDVFRILASDAARNQRIAGDVLAAYREGRKVLVLTERIDHLPLLREALGDEVEHCFVLHGRLLKKQRIAVFAELDALDETVPRVLLATGRLIGEGFDHPPLDTLALTMPISWKGTLQQYAGRLHRYHVDKQDVRIYDYAETDQPQLARMWNKRQRGYRAMGYEIKPMETLVQRMTKSK